MISLISDIHIKAPEDRPHKLLMTFLKSKSVADSEIVVFLGDIFDLLIGGNKKFVSEFQAIFDEVQKLLDQNKKIYYLEGNHDFHIEDFFNNLFPQENFIFSRTMVQIESMNKKIVLCHGDDIEIDNPSYETYSSFIRSLPIKILAEKIVPFAFTRWIGEWASSRSRKKNIEKYEEKTEEIRLKFRKSSELQFEKNKFDILVAGHSHVKDVYTSENGFTYINNGFVPKEKTFLYIQESGHEFVSLVDSSH